MKKRIITAAKQVWSEPKSVTTRGNKYTQYATVQYKGDTYSCYQNVVTPTQWRNYKFQLSIRRPYDDANYISCQYEGGRALFIQNGKVVGKQTLESFIDFCDGEPIRDDDMEFYEYQDNLITSCLDALVEYNKSISPRIIHN